FSADDAQQRVRIFAIRPGNWLPGRSCVLARLRFWLVDDRFCFGISYFAAIPCSRPSRELLFFDLWTRSRRAKQLFALRVCGASGFWRWLMVALSARSDAIGRFVRGVSGRVALEYGGHDWSDLHSLRQ